MAGESSAAVLTVVIPLLLALLAAPVVALAGAVRPRWAAPAGIMMAALVFGATAWGWTAGGGTLDAEWAPTWNLRLTFRLDGLAALYALLASGIGLLVLVYSRRYLPLHLAHEERQPGEQVRFYSFLLLFMGTMVGLVMAQDLILIFVFWDLTAISSYFLIGYDHDKSEARDAALMALLVTGITSLFFLIGAFVLYAGYGTFSLPELIAQVTEDCRALPCPPGALGSLPLVPSIPVVTVGLLLIALAALAKSAQAPFHFWLPRAMAAPTPVSAYLHSAAMVAAGVFLLGRVYPLLQADPRLLDGLLVVGLLSMAVGGILALTRDVLKQLLAYSTIAQYGYVVVMFGLGGPTGAGGAAFYVIAHALVKSALFLTAGAVTEATGEDRLSRLGGLARSLPALAAGSGIAAAGLAAFPLTVGFFKDELFFRAALERGGGFPLLALLGAALTLAYVWRFWSGIFLGPPGREARPIPVALVAPVVVLGLLSAAGGVVVAPFARLAEAAGAVSAAAPLSLDLRYHLEARPENLLALGTYILGALIVVSRPFWEEAARTIARLGDRVGPARWYQTGLDRLNRSSIRVISLGGRDVRTRVASVLLPAAFLVALGVAGTPTAGAYRVGSFGLADLPLALFLALAAFAALMLVIPRDHLSLSLALSGVGYSLVVVFILLGAPDVALVAVLIETLLTLLLLGFLALFPREVLDAAAERPTPRRRRWPNALVGLAAGGLAFVVAWGILSRPAPEAGMAVEQSVLTPDAHAQNIVTAILADFRGLDTMGEITVITIAFIGIANLLRGRKVE